MTTSNYQSSNDAGLTISFNGQVILPPNFSDELIRRIAEVLRPHELEQAPALRKEPEAEKLVRLLYSVQDVAEILGISQKSVYRLLERGLLRSSSALRHKRIPRTEIERFLKTTV